jgi:cellulase
MSADNMKHTFTIPEGVASGEYLLRSEMLALHAAQTLGGGQVCSNGRLQVQRFY